MTCDHEFNYIGDQKGPTASARYFKCIHCGAVKIRSEDGKEYLLPGVSSEELKKE